MTAKNETGVGPDVAERIATILMEALEEEFDAPFHGLIALQFRKQIEGFIRGLVLSPSNEITHAGLERNAIENAKSKEKSMRLKEEKAHGKK